MTKFKCGLEFLLELQKERSKSGVFEPFNPCSEIASVSCGGVVFEYDPEMDKGAASHLICRFEKPEPREVELMEARGILQTMGNNQLEGYVKHTARKDTHVRKVKFREVIE